MEDFHFNNQILNGQKEIPASLEKWLLWAMVWSVTHSDNYTFSKWFTGCQKRMELVANLIAVYDERIQKLDWMSDVTKRGAGSKIAFTRKIGYPDKWKDYAGLEISRDNFFQNLMNATKWNYDFASNGWFASRQITLGHDTLNCEYILQSFQQWNRIPRILPSLRSSTKMLMTQLTMEESVQLSVMKSHTVSMMKEEILTLEG